MKSSSRNVIAAAATVIVAFASSAACLLSAGGGHGSYLPFAILFPYSFLSLSIGPGLGAVAAALAVIQFPVYGVALGRAWLGSSLRRIATLVIGTHVVAATASLVLFFGS